METTPEIVPEGREIARREEMPMAPASVSPVDILRAAVAGGITEGNIAVVERMQALVERQQDRQAERAYNAALARLQRSCRNVVAAKDVDGKFRYAPFLDLWNSVRPHVEDNGFTLEWSQEHLGDRIKKLLTLRHCEGHKTQREWTIRLGTEAPGNPKGMLMPVLDEQADSRAKRRLLMDALNIVVDAVSPAEDIGNGALATEAEWAPLRARLLAIATDNHAEERFLATAQVTEWANIPRACLPLIRNLIAGKEKLFAARKGAA